MTYYDIGIKGEPSYKKKGKKPDIVKEGALAQNH